jgi:putative ABC transport system permease protein
VRSDTVARLLTDPDVEALLEARGFDLDIDGVRRDAFSSRVLKGTIGFNYLEGRAPVGPSEVALGPALAHRLGVEVGDQVRLGDTGEQASVVGLVLARGDTGNSYAESAVVDDDLRRVAMQGSGFREAIVRWADGVDVDAAVDALSEDLEVERIEPPIRVRDLAQIRNLPMVLAGAAGLLGIVLLAHALVVTVRRRGRDLALLRALGARPAQTAVSVLVMTVIIVVAGVVLGVPLGFFLGNLAWRTMADSLFVAADLAVPIAVTLLCLPVALVVALLAAAVPTYRASRLEVADQLRRE